MELSPRLSVHYIDFHLSRSKSSMIVFHSPTKRGETWQLTFRISASSSNLLCFHRQDRTILAVPGLVTPPPPPTPFHNPTDSCCCSWSGGNFRRRHESAEQTRSRTKGRDKQKWRVTGYEDEVGATKSERVTRLQKYISLYGVTCRGKNIRNLTIDKIDELK